MKLVILNYVFLFDPADTGWSSGSKFESTLADFFAAYGYDAEVVQTAGSGVRAFTISAMTPQTAVQQQPTVRQKPTNVLKPQSDITNSFKKFSKPNSSNQPQPQKLNYAPGGRQNAQKVNKMSVKFRGGK